MSGDTCEAGTDGQLNLQNMKHDFIEFWRLYAPLTEFKNRYYACEKLWNQMDERRQLLIVRGLVQENKHSCSIIRKKNPYFFLVDWKGPTPHWLSPAETDRLLHQEVPLAVCRNPETMRYGVVTKEEADTYLLEVHHYM